MTVESNYAIAIVMLSDWLKTLLPAFQPIRIKAKTNRTLYVPFSPHFEQVQIIAGNSDWFIMLFAPVLIGRST